MFFKTAFRSVFTSVADIRRKSKPVTALFEIVRTVEIAFGAVGTAFKGSGIRMAEFGNSAVPFIRTIVKMMPKTSGFLKQHV